MSRTLIAVLLSCIACGACSAQNPSTQPAGKMPHVQVDVPNKQVRVECQMLGVEAPLEFFCVLRGTSEHEAVVRTQAKPSHIHLGLLMLGMQPGEPVRYSEAAQKWLPPHGPPLNISVEFEKDGKAVVIPAYKLMRSIRTQEPMPPTHWIFAGSHVMPDGNYAADVTGYVVSIVNFELTLIDVPELASSANETLQWVLNKDIAPPAGTMVTMVIEPIGKDDLPSTRPRADADSQPVQRDQVRLDKLRQSWEQAVQPHADDLRRAAQVHYQVITEMRREQQRLIDEADRIQRLIDELEKRYQEMTTPRPEPGK
ncbi:MAG: YdjY domain-containing protein [Tepidisphaeraceae bacterium]